MVAACAVVTPGAAQQAQPPRPDTVAADSARRALTAADTIKAPIAAAPVPTAIGSRYGTMRWDRAALFAAGALTLGELIADVPGVTLMTSGFMIAPTALAWHGDPGGVRVFVDGVEREELTIRNAGITDFSLIPLWSLEEVAIEETAGELRVHLRTWRVDRTTAQTRTDVLTGSENLNLFRGYFGKRASNGAVIQLAAQQNSTLSVPGMDGDALGAMARIGWAAGPWSIDVTTLRQGLKRSVGARHLLTSTPDGTAMPAYEGATSMSYARAGWRNPETVGGWAQFTAATLGSTLKAASDAGIAADSGDTTASHSQYALQGGYNRGALRLALAARMRSAGGVSDAAPMARAEWLGSRVTASASGGRRFDGATTWDVRAQVTPFDWLKFSATTGAFRPSGADASVTGSVIDASIRIRQRWIGGGLRTVGASVVRGPVEFDTTAGGPVGLAAGTATTFTAGGPVWRGWMARTDVVRWNAATTFRPQTQARSRLWFASDFKERFPRANFNVLAALTHEYRSRLFVPSDAGPLAQVASAYSVFGTLLEIRIGSAVVSWDARNITGNEYETFPGYLMPRNASFYGIRWEFWN